MSGNKSKKSSKATKVAETKQPDAVAFPTAKGVKKAAKAATKASVAEAVASSNPITALKDKVDAEFKSIGAVLKGLTFNQPEATAQIKRHMTRAKKHVKAMHGLAVGGV